MLSLIKKCYPYKNVKTKYFLEYLGNKLCDSWDRELQKSNDRSKIPNLLRASFKVFGWKFILQGFALLFIEFAFR